MVAPRRRPVDATVYESCEELRAQPSFCGHACCAAFCGVVRAAAGKWAEELGACGAGQAAEVARAELPSLLASRRAGQEGDAADGGRPRPPKADGRVLSHRGNLVCAVEAETLWAVRVLRTAVQPNSRLVLGRGSGRSDFDSGRGDGEGALLGALRWRPGESNMDLLWAWLSALQENATCCCPALLVDPRMAQKAEARNADPARLVGAMNVGHSFKIPWPWDPARSPKGGDDDTFGLDRYVRARAACSRARCVLPDGSKQLFGERDANARRRWYFQKRGRIIMPEAGLLEQPMKIRYCKSGHNCHAGIVESEWMPDEARDIFGTPVSHGKNLIARDDSDGSLAAFFRELDAPFVGAASGSIEQFVLTMEDDCCGARPEGVVPYWAREFREALIGIQTMTLVAGGQHSVAECLIVARDMGYFLELPRVEDGYAPAVAAFEEHLRALGVAPGGGAGPLEELLEAWDRFGVGLRTP